VKAAILHDGGELDIREVPDPPQDGWALVSVRAAGVCGTELHFLDGMIPPPSDSFVLGHEIAGIVAAVPQGSDLQPGDRVAVYNFVGCGSCLYCRTGRESVCTSPQAQLGFSADGGFAELVRVPVQNLIKLPDHVSFDTAAVLSCSGMTAVHAARLADVELGGTGIVNGVGGVGLMVLQVLAAAGARAIAVADSADKAGLASAAGAGEVIVLEGGSGYGELPDRVRELTQGAGADYYFELVGTEETMRAGIRSLARRGTAVLIGYTSEDLRIHPIDLILSEIRIISSVAAARHDLETALRLAADGLLSVTIDTRYPLEEVGTALARLRARDVRGRNVVVF
jgi:D-arabinose 1-dehydrogenase-like Zn-dependent alcohol dehydrogenase